MRVTDVLMAVGLLGAATLFGVTARMATTATTVTIDDEIVLVTLDTLPDDTIIVKKGPEPVVRVVHTPRPRPTPPRAQPAAAPAPRPPAAVAPAPKATLPAPCEEIKWYKLKFSDAQLEAMRVAMHIAKPTAEQRKLIEACLAS